MSLRAGRTVFARGRSHRAPGGFPGAAESEQDDDAYTVRPPPCARAGRAEHETAVRCASRLCPTYPNRRCTRLGSSATGS